MTQAEWLEKFRNKLISSMRERGISQSRLAKDSGLSKSRINAYVSGGVVPTVHAIVNMAYALDMLPSELTDFNERIHK